VRRIQLVIDDPRSAHGRRRPRARRGDATGIRRRTGSRPDVDCRRPVREHLVVRREQTHIVQAGLHDQDAIEGVAMQEVQRFDTGRTFRISNG
jgi:hypothetical protein